jgi:diguanylate cyclase (GGDEF)-like protein
MRPPMHPSSPDYRSPSWVQALGHLIERVGLWPAIAICTLLSGVSSALITLLIAPFLMPESTGRLLLLSVLVPLITTPLISFAVFRLIEDLNLTRKALRQIANHDGLTQAHTRRFFMNAVAVSIPGTPVRSVPDSIVLLDIDDFKQINDRHGHLFGDIVLRAVSDTCRRQLRSEDLFARFGGEEFVILLADAGPDLARSVAERIRRAIADLEIRDPAGRRIQVTASLGIAHSGDRVRGAGTALLEQALGIADRALYAAKRNGKNRFEFATFGESVPLPA